MHETAHNIENKEADGENNAEDNKSVLRKEDKFEEVTNKRDGEGGGHDTNNDKEETSTEFIEGTRNPIDKNEINGESNKH